MQEVVLGWSEEKFQQEVLALAKATGWGLRYHTHDSRRSAAGFPDLVLVDPVRGRVLFRELKREKGKLTPDQVQWVTGLRAAGVDAGTWRPSDWVSGRIAEELTRRA
ncbi:VRR-NUC domain-containing protein [Zhihengliuella sp.]|uniref:VRR-NUC domain-containing protein n=1 Tax=Zhihengliuella sp. TaxID=1954483 RepID=UPI002811127F|nr:VRR-NUC domain-containing protein [Zhihengliuella sp.]